MDGKEEGLESSPKFVFPERKLREPPTTYWTRVIRENLERGVSIEDVSQTVGEIVGSKEEREGFDELTGLKKQRVFWEDLKEIMGHIWRQKEEGVSEKASLILLDLDDFKKENDAHGYLWGNEILKRVAEILQTNRRAEDVVARWGGEEFCLILSGCSRQEASKIAENLRNSIEKAGTTASFGVAESKDEKETPEEFFNRANVACAIAKGRTEHSSVQGNPKNRVVVWQEDMSSKL